MLVPLPSFRSHPPLTLFTPFRSIHSGHKRKVTSVRSPLAPNNGCRRVAWAERKSGREWEKSPLLLLRRTQLPSSNCEGVQVAAPPSATWNNCFSNYCCCCGGAAGGRKLCRWSLPPPLSLQAGTRANMPPPPLRIHFRGIFYGRFARRWSQAR